MCGIIGIVSKNQVVDRLIDGLERLEYRGYDSAVYADGGRLEVRDCSVTQEGGLLTTEGGSLAVRDSLLSGGSTAGVYGGGLRLLGVTDVLIERTEVAHSWSLQLAGARRRPARPPARCAPSPRLAPSVSAPSLPPPQAASAWR